MHATDVIAVDITARFFGSFEITLSQAYLYLATALDERIGEAIAATGTLGNVMVPQIPTTAR